MKAKISLVVAGLAGCVLISFAAEKKTADACTETYDKAVESCQNTKSGCRARGSDPVRCDQAFDRCMKAAKKAKEACEGKSGGAPAPRKPAGKK